MSNYTPNPTINDKMVPTKGVFTIETYDVNNNLIDVYTDNNQIMARVPYNYACMTYGAGCNGYENEWQSGITLSDLNIATIALGTDGVDENNIPKKIDCNRNMLFSEVNLWDAQSNSTITGQNEDMNKYVYQTSFTTVPNPSSDPAFMTPVSKVSEGPSFPWDFTNNKPLYYRMIPDGSNGLLLSDTSMEVKTNHTDLTIKYEFTLGQFAGNGAWNLAPAFSEAALYMKYIPTSLSGSGIDGKPLGAMFSMKTFPKHFKTEACYFRIKWNLIFGTNVCAKNNPPTIMLLGAATVQLKVGDVYVDAGASAYDYEQGSLTSQIVITGLDTLNTNTAGVYTITYTVTDNVGQTASVDRTVVVSV